MVARRVAARGRPRHGKSPPSEESCSRSEQGPSLAPDAPAGLPAELEVTAWSDDRQAGSEIMALCHRTLPVYGVQFHPESVGTGHGKRLLANFLAGAVSLSPH